jgi:cyclohexanone monooxygenase
VAETETPTFSPDELNARYEQERLKRISDGVRSYRSLRDLGKDFDADPFVEPGFTRDPIVEETDVVVVGTGWAGMSTAAYPPRRASPPTA